MKSILEKKLIVNKGVLWTSLASQVVILHLDRKRYYSLDKTGADFWNQLTSASRVEAAYCLLLKEYDIDSNTLLSDIEAFCRRVEDLDIALVC